MTCTICDECETVKHCMQHGCIPKVSIIREKPVVYYVGQPEFWNWNDNPEQPIARLPFVVGHPMLGNCRDVRTSRILKKYFDGTIETLNTIYKPIASEGMGS